MQYLGGKTRIAKQLAMVINSVRGLRPCWDAFCGGLSMTVALGGEVYSSDGNEALITTYKAVMSGWDPPSHVSEDEYQAARALPNADPRKAFIAIGCSFGAKWFGGYARNSSSHNYAACARRHLIEKCTGRHFYWLNFLKIEPRPTSAVLYLDPPYVGTTGYTGVGPFDHEQFYQRVVGWSKFTDVFVSEYEMPEVLGGRLVWQRNVMTSLARGSNRRSTECLYYFRSIGCCA